MSDFSLIKQYIAEVPDFPRPGINYKDITPLLANPAAMNQVAAGLVAAADRYNVEALVGIESRGFIFGAWLASRSELPLVLARKSGKLPRQTVQEGYGLEYGTDQIEIHKTDIQSDTRYAIVDDLIATGGTSRATQTLITRLGGTVACCLFVIELASLNGREMLDRQPVASLVVY